jgi:tetratricopeptide (TPR) repeat protein
MAKEKEKYIRHLEERSKQMIEALTAGKDFETTELECLLIVHFCDIFVLTERLETLIAYSLKLFPNSILLKIECTKNLLRRNCMEDARKSLAEIEYYEPDMPEVKLCRGSYLVKTGELAEALATFDRIVESVDKDMKAKILYDVAIALVYGKKDTEALVYLEKSLQIEPDSVMAETARAACHKRLGHLDTAIKYYNDVLHKYPYFIYGWSFLGDSYLEQKKYRQALEAYQYGLAANPDFGYCKYKSALAYKEMGNTEQAIPLLEEIWEQAREEEQPVILIHLIESCSMAQNQEKMFEYAHRLTELSPESVNGWYGCAMAKLNRLEFAESIPYLEKVVETDPEVLEHWFYLGFSYENEKMYEEAAWAYRHACDIDPARADVLVRFSIVCHLMGNCEEALIHALKAYETDRTATERMSFLIATYYYKLGQTDEMIRYLRLSMEEWRTDAPAYFTRIHPGSRFDLADLIRENDPGYDPSAIEEEDGEDEEESGME